MTTPTDPAAAADRIHELLRGSFVTQCLYVVAQLGIADLLATDAADASCDPQVACPKSAEQLAAIANVHPDALYRVLRALASEGLFHELPDRHFSLTPMGALLRSDPSTGQNGRGGWGGWGGGGEEGQGSLRHAAILAGEAQYKVWAIFKDVVRQGTTGFERIFRKPLFEFLDDHPERHALFNDVMTHKAHWLCEPLVRHANVQPAETVVDIGGGMGTLLIALLTAQPHARGILFDTPRAIQQARPALNNQPELASRLQLLAGDFLSSIPQGNVMILASILHMLPDPQVLSLLAHCRASLHGPNPRLLLVEQVLGPPNHSEPAKWNDLNMMVMTGGRERTFAEYAHLLTQSGFTPAAPSPAALGYSIITAHQA